MSQGTFNIIESFAVIRKNEFYIIGNLINGEVKEQWFVNIALNKGLSLTLRIASVEDVVITNDKSNYKLLVVNADEETLQLLLGLNIGSETATISIEGKD
ncbi:hypothetical protein AM493_01910 [Flavobacterium akiainvivens]|uniref:Uncharacterized protein n=1 Tax=Flavobacterium akiainvivens TaxID=1202724 RepID=A0A0M8MG72_9FLAO|nr:hypothetical protein [Flavobacterium akiainvivens]KOS04928.1 hypothetical protein AM493_01910 [Flavobacterium akiainvivens]SFQ42009.1 hypothetical protein SAMN05444144_104141 [Flavobacterium akiainvivens]